MKRQASKVDDEKQILSDDRLHRAYHHLQADQHGIHHQTALRALQRIRRWVLLRPDCAGWAVVKTDDSVQAAAAAAAVAEAEAEECTDGSAQYAVVVGVEVVPEVYRSGWALSGSGWEARRSVPAELLPVTEYCCSDQHRPPGSEGYSCGQVAG